MNGMPAAPIRTISVIAPMRNEGENVDHFVADLARQDFQGGLEILVADGNSTDDSVERIRNAAWAAGLNLRVLPNPAEWVSQGLNACIREARGDLIVRLDIHSRYPDDYLRRCAELSEQTGAWNVGGRLVPEGVTATERAVACAMDSPFGGIGWTRGAGNGHGPIETDTVTFGAFRPEAFAQAGLYDETLIRNQDDEFNVRLRDAGGRIVLDPQITVMYRPRGSIRRVWRQYYEYGLWKVPVMLKHRRVLTLRSMAPLAFVLGTVVLVAATLRFPSARRLLLLQWGAYAAAAVVFGARSLQDRGEPMELLPRVVAAFPAFHLGHGSGQVVGWLRVLRRLRG
jgi:glycosyltransferase involved in cell wall biosynthesis